MKVTFNTAVAQLESAAAKSGLRWLASSVRSRPDLLAAGLVMLIVMMMIVPLPKPVVDATIAFNFSVAILLVALVTYIPNPLAFSTFPTLLLMVTAFRLAISISTTRLVLLEADAGRIVEAFGAFVVGGNAVVGLVMFLILTVVQFLVVTKGAERIAEVSARFSLDSLPGKQLSIDSDLRAGFIDAIEARRRRAELSRESQLFGAMDGTMKFVKGDAIAGLIIVAINLVGGFAVGMLQHGMSASESIHRFTVLTVGDGLIAQIPALLIALSGGLLIARVAPEAAGDGEKEGGTIGHEISRQLLSEPRAWLFSAVMILLLGFLPGMPFLLFASIAAAVALAGLAQVHSVRRKLAGAFTDQQLSDEGRKDLRRIVPNVPLAVRVASRYEQDPQFVTIVEHVRKLRNGVVAEYGITLPSLTFEFRGDVGDDELQVCIHETPQARISFRPGMIAWRMPPSSTTPPPASLIEASIIPRSALREEGWFWTGAEQHAGLTEAGLFVQSFSTFFDERVRQVLFDHGAQFIGMQEMRAFIGWLDGEAPELAKEIQRTVPLAKLCNLLQQLARERVPVRNFRLIAETLISSGLHDRDPEVIVDFLRQVLRDEITSRYETDGVVRICLLHSALEDELRDGLRQSAVGVYFDLPPPDVEQIYARLAAQVYPDGGMTPRAVIVVPQDLRRPLWHGAALGKRFLPVLSFPELSPNYRSEVIARVEWDGSLEDM
ncbi:type III secretion system export apparatus subunit SctV [soil metagenome]